MLGDRAHAAQQGPCQVVLGQDVAQVAEYLGRGAGQLVQQVEQARADPVASDPPGGRAVPGEQVEVVAFVVAEPQGAGQRGKDLW